MFSEELDPTRPNSARRIPEKLVASSACIAVRGGRIIVVVAKISRCLAVDEGGEAGGVGGEDNDRGENVDTVLNTEDSPWPSVDVTFRNPRQMDEAESRV